MNRGMKIGLGTVGALIVVVVGVSVFLLSNLDGLIKDAVEKVGSDATQAKVSLNDVSISIKSGSGSMSGLTVGNPKGFKTPSAFALGGISITLDTASIGKDPIVIKEVAITKPQVTYELGAGGSNVDAIQKNVNAYAKQFGSGGSAKKEGAKKESEGPKIVINHLYIRGGEISVSAAFLKGKALTTPLPDVHLKDIGKEKKGASPAEIAEKIIGTLTKGAGSAVGALNLDAMMKGAEDAAKAIQDKTKGALEGVTKGTGDAAKGAGETLEKGLGDAGKGLKKLFGN
ncbi:MAG: hypothetical protein ISR51_02450 [Rhodospirillales bacterium]|nr:hypothetical protein [Alphaproteobacteria bacterium]MBL6947514.1 hypothetical protein [Rhodospirillales bacterium]